MIAEFRPDVAHVRNIYHHLSPSILWELKAQKVPVVYHLNDFKVLCRSYNLVLRGEACEACKGGEFWHALTGKVLSGMGRADDAGGGGLPPQMAGHLPENAWTAFLRRANLCGISLSNTGGIRRRFEVLPHFQRVEAMPVAQSGERARTLFWAAVGGKRRRRFAARDAAAARSSTDDCGRRTGARASWSNWPPS